MLLAGDPLRLSRVNDQFIAPPRAAPGPPLHRHTIAILALRSAGPWLFWPYVPQAQLYWPYVPQGHIRYGPVELRAITVAAA
jgi:hypothetical protein